MADTLNDSGREIDEPFVRASRDRDPELERRQSTQPQVLIAAELADRSEALAAQGVGVQLFDEIDDALKAVATTSFALALIDERLQGGKGLELCRHLGLLSTHPLPVIVRLESDTPEQRVQALNAGAVGCLPPTCSDHEVWLQLCNVMRFAGRCPVVAALPCSRVGLERGQCLLDALPGPAIIADANLATADANEAVANLTGFVHEELLKLTLPEIFARMRLTGDPAWLLERLARDGRWQGEIYGRSAGDEPQAFLLDARAIKGKDQSAPGHFVFSFTDISPYKYREQRLRTLAESDALTGVANRNLFLARFNEAIAVAEAGGAPPAVLFIDLDHFKEVNDQHGHAEGDRILRDVARILQGCVRADDLVARLGGDEFGVLLSASSHAAQEETAKRILDRVVLVTGADGGHRVKVTCSIGIAVHPHDGRDAASLLKRADKAMYGVKRSGRNGLCFASSEQ